MRHAIGLRLAPVVAVVACLGVGHADGPTPASPAAFPSPEVPPGERSVAFAWTTFAQRTKAAGGDFGARAKAVEAGLTWLKAHQRNDGAWDLFDIGWCNGVRPTALPSRLEGSQGNPNHTVGGTALAVLAFLAAGHAPDDGGPYAAALGGGLRSLAAAQDAGGCVGPRADLRYIYDHALGALALVEAFSASGDAVLLESAQRAVGFSLAAKNPYFSWRYGVKPGDNDTSVTAMMTLALAAASRINAAAAAAGRPAPFEGLLAEPLDPFEGGLEFVRRMTEPSGRAGYIFPGGGAARTREQAAEFPPDQTEAPTAAALVVRMLAPKDVPRKPDDAADTARGLAVLDRLPPRWSRGKPTDLYYWHHAAIAQGLRGGESARAFDKALVSALVASQRKDGGVCDVLGSWDTFDPWGAEGGRTFTTAMAVLCLCTPGRFAYGVPAAKDVLAELSQKGLPPARAVRLLRFVASERVPESEGAVLPWAESTAEATRAAAMAALAHAGSPTAGAVIVKGLGGTAPRVRAEALRAFLSSPPPDSSLLASVQALLAQGDPAVRIGAARALARFGPAAEPARSDLLALAGSGDALGKVAAAEALAAIEPASRPAAAVLTAALKDTDTSVRREAARVGIASGSDAEAFVAALRGALGDADPWVAASAAVSLRRRGLSDDRLLPKLAAGLAAKNAAYVAAVLAEIVALGPAARPALAQIAATAHRGPAGARAPAIDALVAIGGKDVVAHLSTLKEHPSPDTRRAAEEATARLALEPAALADAIAARLMLAIPIDPDELRGARAGLRGLGTAAVPAVRKVLDAPATPPASLLAALDVATDLGPDAKDLEPSVVPLVGSSFSSVATSAVGALVRMRVTTTPMVEALKARAARPEPGPAEAAIEALAILAGRSSEVVPVFTSLLDDASLPETTRVAGIAAAGYLRENGAPLVPKLLEWLAQPEKSPLRVAAAKGLGRLGPVSIQAMRQVIVEGREPPLTGVLEAVDAMTPENAMPLLPDLLTRLVSPPWPGKATEAAIASIGTPAVPPLLAAASRAKGREIRIVRVLGMMWQRPKEAIPFLERMSRSKDDDVAAEALRTLLLYGR